jgi:DNA-binding MarR family transcriptional regulator
MEDTRWLSQSEQQSWRSWLKAVAVTTERTEQDMKRDNDMSMAEYEVLVRLSESPGRRLRMTDLADRTLASKSRLSHQVARMEAAGLVGREGCAEDRRGAYAVLTELGWNRLVAAAPSHVESVRSTFLDALTAEEFALLGALSAKVVAHAQDRHDNEHVSSLTAR